MGAGVAGFVLGATLALKANPFWWLGATAGASVFVLAYRSPHVRAVDGQLAASMTPTQPETWELIDEGDDDFSLPEELLDRFFRERLQALYDMGMALLSYDNHRLLRDAPRWSEDVYDLLWGALEERMQAVLFRDSGPNTEGLPEEVRWRQRLPHQVTQLQNLLSGSIQYRVRESWKP
jgi:hypothetical protein